MLTFLPVISLIAIAIVVLVLRRLERGTGFAWLAAIIFTLLIWGTVLSFHWFDVPTMKMIPWRPYDPQNADQVIFGWDDISWGMGFALVSLVLCLLLTAPARLQFKSNPITWSANLSITAVGLLAILAVTPLATVIAWTLLDIIELVLVIRLIQDKQMINQAVLAFSVKVAGTLVLVWAMILARSTGIPLDFQTITAPNGVFLLIAAGLRLGVLPLNLPYVQELPLQRGLSNTLRMTAQASSLVILAKMPSESISSTWISILLPLTAMATLFSAAMWATAKNELVGRRYWSMALAGFAVLSVLQGDQIATFLWGLILIIPGGIILFYSARSKALLIIPAVGIVGMFGLPYTPAAAGIQGIVTVPIQFWDVLMMITLSLLIAGYARLCLLPGDSFSEMEPWVIGVYPAGLLLLGASGWLAALLGVPGGLNPGIWWVSLISMVLAGIFFWFLWVVKPVSGANYFIQNIGIVKIKQYSSQISKIFRLGWFYSSLWIIFKGIRQVMYLITSLLEGEGGILWAILLVALLLTILTSGGFLG
jgi:hypothetical protein